MIIKIVEFWKIDNLKNTCDEYYVNFYVCGDGDSSWGDNCDNSAGANGSSNSKGVMVGY